MARAEILQPRVGPAPNDEIVQTVYDIGGETKTGIPTIKVMIS